MKRIQIKRLLKEILDEEKGYSKYSETGTTDGLTQDTLNSLLKNIATSNDDEDDMNENVRPNIIFTIYEHIIDRLRERTEDSELRMSIFEELYPSPSSFYEDIEQLIQ